MAAAVTTQDNRAWFPLERASRKVASLLPVVALQASRPPRHRLNLYDISSSYIPLKHSSCTFPLTYICARLCPLLRGHHCPIHSTSLSHLCHKIITSTALLSHPVYLSFIVDSSYSLCFNFSSFYFHRSHSQGLLVTSPLLSTDNPRRTLLVVVDQKHV